MVCCSLLRVVRKVLCFVWFVSFILCCRLLVVGCLLLVVCCVMCDVRCGYSVCLFDEYCRLVVVCCLWYVVFCVLFVMC